MTKSRQARLTLTSCLQCNLAKGAYELDDMPARTASAGQASPHRHLQAKSESRALPSRGKAVHRQLSSLGRVFRDAERLNVSRPQPSAQLLLMRLVVGPEAGRVPGLIETGRHALAESLGWDADKMCECLMELTAIGEAEADWVARLVWIRRAVQWVPPANPNMIKAWARRISEMPECGLLDRAILGIKDALVDLDAKRATMASRRGFAAPKPLAAPMDVLAAAALARASGVSSRFVCEPETNNKPLLSDDEWTDVAADILADITDDTEALEASRGTG